MGQSRYRPGITLSEAHDNGAVVTVACHYCRTKRHYLPQDLKTILGDIDPRHVAQGRRCENCRRNDYLVVRVWHPIPQDTIGMVIRRLERLVTVRRAVWRDERLD